MRSSLMASGILEWVVDMTVDGVGLLLVLVLGRGRGCVRWVGGCCSVKCAVVVFGAVILLVAEAAEAAERLGCARLGDLLAGNIGA